MYAYLVHSPSSHRRAHLKRNTRARARLPRQRRLRIADLLRARALPLVWLLILLASVCCFSFLLLMQAKHGVSVATPLLESRSQTASTAPPVLSTPLDMVREQKIFSHRRKMPRSVHDSHPPYIPSSCARGSRSYVIAAGDTLSTIAARFGTTWMALSSFNQLPDPNLIQVGQALCIPSAALASGNLYTIVPTSPTTAQFVALARVDALNAGIPPDYFVRQINQESGFNPTAVSWAGAVGIAQFMPGTAATIGVDPWNPTQAMQGAARLMASYENQYGGNYTMALAAYNGGTGTVQYAVTSCGANWRNCLPPETQNYLNIILG